MNKEFSNPASIFQALLVTLLWSSSFIIIKIGLEEIPPLVFAGLRYIVAFTFLLPLLFRKENIHQIKNLSSKDWRKLFLLGLVFYTFTQGAQFFGLYFLPSVTVSLILNFTPIITALMGMILINENLNRFQWMGSLLFIVGVLVYFLPVDLSEGSINGILIMIFGVLANSGAAVLGREINRSKKISPMVITGISMGIGSLFLLLPGILFQGFPKISSSNLLLLFWMASINTAFAFTLWNKTLRNLTAVESSVINGTMLIQIGVLAWIFLGESISIKEGAGMLIAAAGAAFVQMRYRKKILKKKIS